MTPRRLAQALLEEAYRRASAAPALARLPADAGTGHGSPVGWFGRLRTDNGCIDLKRAGLFPVVSAARILAIRHNIAARATPERLDALIARSLGGGADLSRLKEAHRLFMRRILEQQVEDIADGRPPGNRVALRRLTPSQQSEMRDALTAIAHVDALVRDMLF